MTVQLISVDGRRPLLERSFLLLAAASSLAGRLLPLPAHALPQAAAAVLQAFAPVTDWPRWCLAFHVANAGANVLW